MDRLKLKIVGESGAGLLSTGEIVIDALKEMGYYIVADREYPSLIKGGHSCFVINASDHPIAALSEEAEIMVAIDRQSLEAYFDDLKKGGVLIHGYERPYGLKDEIEKAKKRKIEIVHLMSREIAESVGGNVLMTNVVLVGMLWKVLGFDYKYVKKAVEKKFASKPKLLEIDLRCLKKGFELTSSKVKIKMPIQPKKNVKKILIDGNKAVALGAIHAGCRAYYAYPMSPSSSILTHMAELSHETGMLVKQVEDEISVVNMALGSMFMGTRALAATSGGGYDLMTETVSLAGIIENPLVVVLCQRPGPGTGLPTWTAQGDLNLAIYSSHGEFARLVIAVSDPASAFELTQHAFNFAEKYQIPVLLLSEKVICESKWTVPPFKQNTVPIERGLVEGAALKTLKNEDRYKVTADGLSKRWIPGSSKAYYFANGDEHWEDGSLTEEAKESGLMYEKRNKKLKLIEQAMPEPQIFGAKNNADISFVGWGSSKNTMLDVIEIYRRQGVKVNYLHFDFVYPLKTRALKAFFKSNKNVHLIEGNYHGQFGDLVEAKSEVKFKKRLLKYNGRPFFVEDVMNFIDKNKS